MRALLAAGACLALAACGSLANVDATVGKTLAAAQDGVATAAVGAHNAYISGNLSKADVRVVDGFVDQVDDVSLTARCAYAAHDLDTVSGALAQIGSLAIAITAVTDHRAPPALGVFTNQTCVSPAPVAAVVAP